MRGGRGERTQEGSWGHGSPLGEPSPSSDTHAPTTKGSRPHKPPVHEQTASTTCSGPSSMRAHGHTCGWRAGADTIGTVQAPQEGAKPEEKKKTATDHGSPIPVTPGHQHAPACMPCEACKIFKSCVLLPSPACRGHIRGLADPARNPPPHTAGPAECAASLRFTLKKTWLPTRPPLFSSCSRCLVGGFTWGLFVRFQDIEMGTMPSRGPPGSARTTRVSLPVCGHQSTPGFPGCCKPQKPAVATSRCG